jgi:hypothetical protein
MMRVHPLNEAGVAKNREEIMSYAAIASARQSCRTRHIGFALGMVLTAWLSTPLLAAEAVLVPFPHDFAESITATSDGALIYAREVAFGTAMEIEQSFAGGWLVARSLRAAK